MFNEHAFQLIVDNAIANYITAFQWGYTVAPTPKAFAKILVDQAVAYGINWAESFDPEGAGTAIAKAVTQYTKFYADLLTKPKPENPTDEFSTWFNEVHP